MSIESKIEWCDATWNILAGCSKVSPGCKNCYAIPHAHRMAGNPNAKVSAKYEGTTSPGGTQWTGRVNFAEHLLEWPLRQRKPLRIFVNAMSDLFHEEVPDTWIDRIFLVMALRPQHTFQILTKRPERMRDYLTSVGGEKGASERFSRLAFNEFDDEADCFVANRIERAFGRATGGWPLSNVWLGVSAEDQRTADARVPLLLQTPAAVRFISAEPLLGPLDLFNVDGRIAQSLGDTLLWPYDLIAWVIVGGESGPDARPMHPDWARSLRDHCGEVGVPFFFKQWGEYAPTDYLGRGTHWAYGRGKFLNWIPERGAWHESAIPGGSTVLARVGKKNAGRELDGRTWSQFPGVSHD